MMKTQLSEDARADATRRVLLRSSAGNFESNLNDLKTASPISSSVSESVLTSYEHESGRSVISSTSPSSTENYKHLKNIDVHLQDYMKKNYNSPGVEAGVQVIQVKADSYDIIVYAEKADLKNCYSGSWKGHFHVECKKGDVALSGKVQVFAQLFETDHVQMTCELHFPPKQIEVSRIDEDVSMAVIREFEQMDSKVMKAMEGMYDNITGDLKSLRKAIPVTRTKFDWNLNSSRFRRTLSNGLHIK